MQKETIVLKVGGSIASVAQNIASDIAKLQPNCKVVLVHGGGPQVTALETALGRVPHYIYSKEGFKSRHTDKQTMENFVMAVAGGVNSSLVQLLRKNGVAAVGVSGISGVLAAKRKTLVSFEGGKEKIIRDDYSGKIGKVGKEPLLALLEAGLVPVVAPLALGEEFEALNVDGDRAAAAIACELSAQKLLLFTDVEGFYSNFPDGLLQAAKLEEIDSLQPKASAGMKRKLVAAKEALCAGVGEVIICSGKIQGPISAAMQGGGTHFTK